METTVPFKVSVIGQNTGKPYDGTFTLNLIISRREAFVADERRRTIIGANPLGVAPALNGEAYMLGQLYVRLSNGPSWWKDSEYGLDLSDENVIGEMYRSVELKIKEHEASLASAGKTAVNNMAKAQKVSVQPADKME
jgi:hypothetical protein